MKAHLRLLTLDLRHAALGSLTRARHGHESQANANAPIPFVLSHRFVVSLDPLSLVAVQQTAGLGWASALMLIEWGWNRSASPAVFSLTAWGWAAATGVIFFALGYWLYFSGLKAVRANNAAPFLSIIPVFGVAGGYVFLHERLVTAQWVGAILILLAITGISRQQGIASPATG